jgi:divalent metal cation (Fe/Co/Zn/Cd) transporter
VERVLQGFRSDEVRFDHVRTRRAGTRRFVGMHMHMPAHWSLGRAADFRLQVERALTRHIAGVVVTIEMLPQGQESLQEGGQEANPQGADPAVASPSRSPLAD